MAPKPTVTILIPTFNRIALLPDALRSALAQTYPNIRVLVFDDGSEDGTLNWLRGKQRKYGEQKLTVIGRKRNAGIVRARQTLVDSTKTEFNAWLDSDDMRNIHSIQLQMTAMEKWDAPFVRTSAQILGDDKGRWKQPPKMAYAKRHSVATGLFRKSCAPRYRANIRFLGEDILWEMDMTVEHGTGMLLPFECYYIRRGRHNRAMSGLSKGAKAEYWPHYVKLRADGYKRLAAMGINGHARVERVSAGAIPTGLELPAGTKMELPTIFKAANLATSRRQPIEPGPHRIKLCPLCGFRLNNIICADCGSDWSEHCYCPTKELRNGE